MPESAHRAVMAGRYCWNTDASSCPVVILADRVSNAISRSPCRWLSWSPHGMCSFSRASTNTRTPGEEVKRSACEREARLQRVTIYKVRHEGNSKWKRDSVSGLCRFIRRIAQKTTQQISPKPGQATGLFQEKRPLTFWG